MFGIAQIFPKGKLLNPSDTFWFQIEGGIIRRGVSIFAKKCVIWGRVVNSWGSMFKKIEWGSKHFRVILIMC